MEEKILTFWAFAHISLEKAPSLTFTEIRERFRLTTSSSQCQ